MIIDFELARKKNPPATLRENDIFNTQGWFIIEEFCKDQENVPICYLRQPRVSLDNFESFLHPSERQRETIAENDLRHNIRLEDSFFKVIVANPEQIIAVQAKIDGIEVDTPYYIKFSPKTILEIPLKINYKAPDPICINFTN